MTRLCRKHKFHGDSFLRINISSPDLAFTRAPKYRGWRHFTEHIRLPINVLK